MILKPLTNGATSGVLTVNCESKKFGGALITADGTNAAVVKIQEKDVNGSVIFHFSPKTSQFVSAPFKSLESQLYCSISGTGASAQLFEWVD